MEANSISDRAQPLVESTSLTARALLILFALAAGFGYRFLVGLLPPSILQAAILLVFAGILLLLTYFARQTPSLRRFAEIPFAFFVFTVAGILGDQGGFIQQTILRNVLHQAPTVHNPLGSSVTGMIAAQLVSTLFLVVPVFVLTLLSGRGLKSIFVSWPTRWWPLLIGVVGFVFYFLFALSGRAERLFPTNGMTRGHFLALTPVILLLVLCNGLREELWFRGLFLKKYGKFLSPFSANLLSALIFASFHVQVQYTPALIPFLIIALVLGLVFGYLMQKSDSLLPSLLFHAGSDIPIFLVYLSYV